MTRVLVWPTLVGALASSACSTTDLVVAVTALPADCTSEVAAPIAGATVTARCAGRPGPEPSFTADAKGLLRRELEEPLPIGCDVVVAKDGYQPRTYALRDVCAAVQQDRLCLVVSLSARLAARRTDKGAP